MQPLDDAAQHTGFAISGDHDPGALQNFHELFSRGFSGWMPGRLNGYATNDFSQYPLGLLKSEIIVGGDEDAAQNGKVKEQVGAPSDIEICRGADGQRLE